MQLGQTARWPRSATILDAASTTRRDRARPARLTVVEWRHGPRSERGVQDAFMALAPPGTRGHGVRAAESRRRRPTSRAGRRRSRTTGRRGSARRRPACRPGARYLVRDGDRWLPWDADWGGATSDRAEDGRAGVDARVPARPRSSSSPRSGSSSAADRGRGTGGMAGDGSPPRDDETGTRRPLPGRGRRRRRSQLAIDAERGALLRSRGVARRRAVPPPRGDRDRVRADRRRTRSRSRRPRGTRLGRQVGSPGRRSRSTSSPPPRRSPCSCRPASPTGGASRRRSSSTGAEHPRLETTAFARLRERATAPTP